MKYAHANSCPYDACQHHRSVPLISLEVLRYVWEHMERTWAEEMVRNAVRQHVLLFIRGPEPIDERSPSLIEHWRVPLYLKRFSGVDVRYLEELAAVGRARAAALAECLNRRKGRQGRRGTVRDDVMARCPAEVFNHIASEPHLVLPYEAFTG